MAGLSAAQFLCAQGAIVQLFEANGKVGGSCSTTRVGDYVFNDGAVHLAIPSMLEHLFRVLELDRKRLLPLRRIESLQSTFLPDGTTVNISSGPEVSVAAVQGAEDAQLQVELNVFLAKWEPILRFFADEILIQPLSLLHLLTKGWRHLVRMRGTAAAHLESTFSNDAVRAAFGGALLYAGAPPEKQPAAALLGLVSMLQDGFFVPVGGMGRIPEVICGAVKSEGGQLHLNSAARHIKVRNGHVYAIEIDNFGTLEVDAVISTVSAMHTYRNLLSDRDVPARLMRKVRQAPLSHRGFVLQLGLKGNIEAQSHINCIIPMLADQSQIFRSNGKQMSWATYMVPTLTLPETAPEGCSVVDVYPPIDQQTAPAAWSTDRKEQVAEQALALLRRHHNVDIAVTRILSPREFRDDMHLYDGALYGLSPSAGPGALFNYRTPIRGLYLAGQTTWPGFGVAGAGLSGVFAARTLMRDVLQ
jgi:phytoene desaturase